MKTMKRLFMCLLMMGIFTAATGCDDFAIYDSFGDWDTYDESWSTGSSSGTFFSDYGGSVSWW